MPNRLRLASASILAAWLLLFASAPVARAQSYYWPEGAIDPGNGWTGPQATYIYRFTVTLAACTNNTFETTNLTPAADTILHLVWNSTEVGYNDDYAGQLRSRVTYNIPCGGGSRTVTAYVRARSNGSGGQGGTWFNFSFNGFDYGQHDLGGYTLASGNVTTSTLDTMETVYVNNGAKSSLLMRLVWTGDHYAYSAINQTSGIGTTSKLVGSTSTNERWIVGTAIENNECPNPPSCTLPPVYYWGPIRVVRNDAQLNGDQDLDGLGNFLELEACTCKAAGNFSCLGQAYTCTSNGTSTPKDTDSDGISDKREMLGIDGGPPQYLALWGANPRRRDIFVEFDQTSAGSLSSEPEVGFATGAFTGLNITNPDGSSGISVHWDIGQACTNEANDSDMLTGICGDFGGHDVFAYDPAGVCSQDIAGMNSLRLGVFHYFIRYGVNGNTNGQCSYISNDHGRPLDLVAHELGHQIGLEHNGDNTEINHAPTYRSLMNYAYGSAFYVAGVNRPQFSNGSLSTPVNPVSLSETTDFGGSVDLDFLLNVGSAYNFDSDNSSPRHVDWNRDGIFSPSVRAHVIGEPNQRHFGKDGLPQALGESNLPVLLTDAAPGADYFPPYTFVVVNKASDHQYHYNRRTSGGWSSWTQLTGSPSFLPNSSPLAIVAPKAGVDLLYVFGVTQTGVTFAKFDSQANPDPSGWATIQFPPNAHFQELSGTVVGSRLYIVGSDDTDEFAGNYPVWLGWFDDGVWQGWTAAQIGGAPLHSGWGNGQLDANSEDTGAVTPGIAAGPASTIFVYVRDRSDSVVGGGGLKLYKYNTTTLTWSDALEPANGTSDTSCRTNGRITTIYRPYRTGTGAQLTNGSLWSWYNTICDDTVDPLHPKILHETFYRWTWGMLSASTEAFTLGAWHRTDIGQGDCKVWKNGNGAGVAVVDHPDALGVFLGHDPTGTPPGSTCAGGVWWVPHADGENAPGVLADDHDDVSFIRNNLCSSVHAYDGGACNCGEGISCAPAPDTGDLCYDDPDFFP